ncbi:hypothetical protein GQ55_8G218800 [Panicum hallii var. hallii]|uniref:Uncharacterized protein n=1 Tax=Panicum hallii var. hallii TaxID=1504633 RepID=A0A2T7CPW0_9POAL|nr:hypothetical protein GQ55_8G218800 [Panicum hallii var. hallii]
MSKSPHVRVRRTYVAGIWRQSAREEAELAGADYTAKQRGLNLRIKGRPGKTTISTDIAQELDSLNRRPIDDPRKRFGSKKRRLEQGAPLLGSPWRANSRGAGAYLEAAKRGRRDVAGDGELQPGRPDGGRRTWGRAAELTLGRELHVLRVRARWVLCRAWEGVREGREGGAREFCPVAFAGKFARTWWGGPSLVG